MLFPLSTHAGVAEAACAARTAGESIHHLQPGTHDWCQHQLGDAIWAVTEDTSLNVEIYRQALFRVPTAGGAPTQAGYDQMARDILTKLAREFPLQPCDARSDKPGKGCPRNP